MTPTNAQLNYYRTLQIAESRVRKGGHCDICGGHATDMHELFARSLTRGNPVARLLSYQKELCAILCRQCHGQATNPHIRNMLLLKNAEIYGYGNVKSAYLKLQATMRTDLPPFPQNVEVYEL